MDERRSPRLPASPSALRPTALGVHILSRSSGRKRVAQNLNSFAFDEVVQAPRTPGVYAWYFRSDISHKDIQELGDRLLTLDSPAARRDAVRAFLNDNLFNPLAESPYEVTVSGPLKPKYEGLVEHKLAISDGLVSRIAEEPSRLLELDAMLRLAVPYFASPIYIGVAKVSLRRRLKNHRKLILKYREGIHGVGAAALAESPDRQADHSFAYEVTHQRNLHPSLLSVYTLEMPIGSEIALDAEKVLNRLNFPLCGRQ